MVMICLSFSLTSIFKYNGLSYKKLFMSVIFQAMAIVWFFTFVVGMVYSDVWEECTAPVFRVT
jgi:hypothetical protein